MKKMNSKNLLGSMLKYAGIAMLVLVTGKGFSQTQTLVSHNFNTSCGLPGGWLNINVDGSCAWRCDYGGFTQNNHNSQGCSGAANDWLVLPYLDLTSFQNENINVNVSQQYSGGSLTLRYSQDYPGSGNPNSYSWSQVYNFTSATAINISLNGLPGSGYLAFLYTSSGSNNNEAARWTLNTVSVTGEPALVIDSLKIDAITTSQVGLEANVLNSGGQTVTERGFVWSVSPNPVLNGAGVTKVSLSGGVGQFSASAAGLPSGTRIYVKGFASTANLTKYTVEKNFYTLSDEPTSYPSTFTATTLTKNSIQLDWSAVGSASGYLIMMHVGTPSTGIPADANPYYYLDALGDGEVAAVVEPGSTNTITVNDLIQGTRYYFTLFPYAYNGSNDATLNYKTNPVIPVASDSTLGLPPSYTSILAGLTGSGAFEIPSLQNQLIGDSSKGTQVWSLQLRDGGTSLNDADDLPTILNSITLLPGSYNTVSNWSQSIKDIVLVDDSTGQVISYGLTGPNSIYFSGFALEAADDNYRPVRIKMSLNETPHTDKSRFHFVVNTASTELDRPLFSSQAANFVSASDSAMNHIEVVATRLTFINHPAAKVEAGSYLSLPLQVAARDTFNGLDLDFADTIILEATAGNLMPSQRTSIASGGIASFDSLRFNKAAVYDTLIASCDTLFPGRGNRFEVEVSKLSDIVASSSFVYPQNFRHLDYLSGAPLTQTNSLEVFSLWMRDGGANGDNDFEPTSLTRLDITVTNADLVRGAALFAGNKKLAETNTILVSGSTQYVSFTGLDTLAADNDSINLSLRLSFKEQANDGDRFSFLVKEAFTIDTLSRFAGSNAGGAASSVLGNNNRINIQASRLQFVAQPGNTYRGAVMNAPVSVVALDSAGNKDLTGRAITLSVTGSIFSSGTVSTAAVTSINQSAKFDHLLFGVAGTNAYLVAHSGNLDSAASDSFSVIVPVWYRSIKSGNWSDVTVWETSLDFGSNWSGAAARPNFSAHGEIRISAGDTVRMDGTTVDENTVDELIIEAGAILITPSQTGTYLTVNNSSVNDVDIYGTLLHQNPSSGTSISFDNNATIRVKKAGAIELKSFGDALHWAGNINIFFEDSSFYIHSTDVPNTIAPGLMFPNASSTERPVFRINDNQTFPGSQFSASLPLEINGVLDIAAGKTLVLEGNSVRSIRNGLSGEGDLLLQGSAETKITGEAQISGGGQILVDGNAQFKIASSSHTQLLNDRVIASTNGLPFVVDGMLDAGVYRITGTTSSILSTGATLITAHSGGVNASFANTGSKTFDSNANYIFNGGVPQVSGMAANAFAAKVWVKNGSGLTLSGDLTVRDTLFLETGNILSGLSNTLNTMGAISGYSPISYVEGPLNALVSGMGSRVFPIGSTSYGAITFHSAVSTEGWVTMEYNNTNPHGAGYDTSRKAQSLAAVHAGEFWVLSADSFIQGSVEIPFTNHSNLGTALRENIRVISWSGSEWQSEGPLKRDATLSSVTSNTLANYTVLSIGVDSSCTIPSAPVFVPATVCGGSDLLLTANGNGTLRWFVNQGDEMPFASGNNLFIPGIMVDTVFYAEVKNMGCVSQRVAYPVTFHTKPSAPVVSGNTSLCFRETTVLSVAAPSIVYWYEDEFSQNPLFIGNSFPTGFMTGDTAFYAQVIENGCAGERTLTKVSAKAEIGAPYTTGAEVCEGNAASIRVTANNSVRWFTTLSGSTPFLSGEKFTTSLLFKDTAFYAEAFDGQCKSARTHVLVEVLPLPKAPVLSQEAACKGTEVTLVAEGTDVLWFSDSASVIPIAEGLSFTTPKLFNTRRYFATSGNGKCTSPKASAWVTVYDVPQAPSINMVATIPANEVISVSTSAVTQNYLWDFGTDATPQTAIGPGPHQVLWTSEGPKTVRLQVWNGNSVLLCDAETEMQIDVQTGLSARRTEAKAIRVYPNPVGESELFVELAAAEPAQVIVLDAFGRKVFENTNHLSGAGIETNGWAAGVYFVNVISLGSVQTVKVVKQ